MPDIGQRDIRAKIIILQKAFLEALIGESSIAAFQLELPCWSGGVTNRRAAPHR
jgi:hypothetical protein